MNEICSRIVDFERICRLCLHEKRILMDIFEADEENSNFSIYHKIKACATIDCNCVRSYSASDDGKYIRGDGLPTRICVPCLASLNAAFEFRVQCENADKILHNICHLLISDEVKNKKAIIMVNNIEKSETECKELQSKQLQLTDHDHIIVIKREDEDIGQEKENDLDDDEKEEEEKETEELLNMINVLKKNKEPSYIISDGLISINEDDIPSNESLDVVSFQSEEAKKSSRVSFPVEKNCSEETSGVTPTPNKGIGVGAHEEKTKKTPIGDTKKSACPFCNKMLTRVNDHIRLLHQNKVYICKKQNCGAEFLTLKNLQSHQLKCYNMEKPYKCPRCFKEFHRKCNYKAHIIRHSNKKDFQCQLCDKAFVDSTGLKRHFLKHHEPQETFVSGCCEKKFKTKEGLKQHIQKGICGVRILQVVESNNETM